MWTTTRLPRQSQIRHLTCFLTLYIASVSGTEEIDNVFLAHQTNLVNITQIGNKLRYKSVIGGSGAAVFRQVRGLDCDRQKRMLCWTDSSLKVVRCSDPKPTEKCADGRWQLFGSNIVAEKGQPESVALDPCNMMLYWTDKTRSTIGVVNIKRNDLNNVVPRASMDILSSKDGLKYPFAIAVDSCAGYVFFTDLDTSNQRVVRAETDGSNVRTIVTASPSGQSLQYPTALALERKGRTVYFADGVLSEIYKMNYDGGNFKKVQSTAGAIYDMALGCSNRQIFYSTLVTNHPVYMPIDGSRTIRLPLNNVGQHVYYGACSYCDNCHCKSANPCASNNGGCSHFCFPTPNGGRKCGCPPGYKLPEAQWNGLLGFVGSSGQTKCEVASLQLLVGNGKKLLSLQTDSRGLLQGNVSEVSFGRVGSMVAVDYVERAGHHYVVFTDNTAVKRRELDGSDGITIVQGLPGLRGIAADCVTGNIYYADMKKGLIAVSNLEGTGHRICYATPVVKSPFSIALNTRKGLFYFSDIGKSAIYSASMDCSMTTPSPHSLVYTRLAFGLTLDENRQVLYWTEFLTQKVKYLNIGRGETVSHELSITNTLSRLNQPFGLTLLQEYLYFTDWGSGCVGRISRLGGSVEALSCNHDQKVNGITHVPKKCYPPQGGGSCSGCKAPRMCMSSSDRGGSLKCACPTGFISSQGGKCKLPSKEFILVSARNSINALSLSGSSDWIARLPLPPQENIIAIDYDYRAGKVFWTDVASKKIQSANLDGTDLRTLLSHDPTRSECRLCVPDGLAYDSVHRRLYYTDHDAGEICYFSAYSSLPHNLKVHRVVKGLDKPRAIVVHRRSNKLYFTEWGTIPTISSVNIPFRIREVSSSLVVLSSNLTWPNALAASRDGSKLYFGDGFQDYFASFDIWSRTVRPLGGTPHIFGIDEHRESSRTYVYWSDWQTGVSKKLVSGGNAIRLASATDVYRASGIKVYTSQQ